MTKDGMGYQKLGLKAIITNQTPKLIDVLDFHESRITSPKDF